MTQLAQTPILWSDVGEQPEAARTAHALRVQALADLYRRQSLAFSYWAAGYGLIRHNAFTQVRVRALADLLVQRAVVATHEEVYRYLAAADRLTSAGMWLVVHMTYARNVYLDGRELKQADFKTHPDGHTGGSLNMVPAYVGYLAVNALTGITRSWLMGQGHCVAAIDAANVLVGNMTAAHSERYELSDEGLTRLVRDFYSYELRPDGQPASPLGSHVNAHTAGGLMEGGYLGFAELQYIHMPLPGERLVVFLSDGAFEEQRGGDWAPRWWRAEDSGLVAPIMIANGRRIDQRTTSAQEGGVAWLRRHLDLNGFLPLALDGRDTAEFVWGVFEMEEHLDACAHALHAGQMQYPAPMGYAVAEAPKGYGFPGAGTNLAHNLPLGTNPAEDVEARRKFNAGARALYVPLDELIWAIATLNNHARQQRPRERDHALAHRHPPSPRLPEPEWRPLAAAASPMDAIDSYFVAAVKANPELRPRVGNPDEMRSNRLNATLDLLKHRVTAPEPGVAEAVNGAVITALNEEAVVSAALANKGGINLVASYEAFAMKMLGAVRQELTFARHQRMAGYTPGWLAVPLILTSHVWENGKNEQSHQDPSLSEALLGEMSDGSRVVFPADWNTAAATLRMLYGRRGEIWALVLPKRELPVQFDPEQTQALIEQGALRVRGTGAAEEQVVLVAVGAYQLLEALRAADRLQARGIAHAVVYILDPARFRAPRDDYEAQCLALKKTREALFPPTASVRLFLTHMRPDLLRGMLKPLDTGERTTVLGYINHGGTLDVFGMLFANRCTWAHALASVADILNFPRERLLSEAEVAAVEGRGDPRALA